MVFRYFYENKDVTTDQSLAGKILWLRTRNTFTLRCNETLTLHRKSINFAIEIATEYFGENLNCLITERSAGGALQGQCSRQVSSTVLPVKFQLLSIYLVFKLFITFVCNFQFRWYFRWAVQVTMTHHCTRLLNQYDFKIEVQKARVLNYLMNNREHELNGLRRHFKMFDLRVVCKRRLYFSLTDNH